MSIFLNAYHGYMILRDENFVARTSVHVCV